MKIDLAGLWRVHLAPECADALPDAYEYTMELPGTTSAAGLGPENPACPEGHLTDVHAFEGRAWFRRTFATDEQAPLALLRLERTRMTSVRLDGALLGRDRSLCAPHDLLVENLPAGEHELIIAVDNAGYPTRGGHMTSRDTQSNWNGVTGEISLTLGETLLRRVTVTPQEDLRSVRVTAQVVGAQPETARLAVADGPAVEAPVREGRIDALLTFDGQPPLWDEFHPNLLRLTVTAGSAQVVREFGMRRMHTKGRRLLVNGQQVFLRGKHDGLVFPLTGYAPTDVDSWLRVLRIAQSYGVNHYRFHTCCPPEAAFYAADRLGIYMEPELPFWGTVNAPGEEGFKADEQAYLIEEGFRILDNYGWHPSFVMMSLGNELWGSKERLNEMLRGYKAHMPDKLYTSGSNNFQFVPTVLEEEQFFAGVRLDRDRLFRGSYAMCDAPQGHVQLTEPESVHDYDAIIAPDTLVEHQQAAGKTLIQYGTGVREVEAEAAQALIPQVPVISHEVGQYTFYPDFNEIPRYTGPLKPRNFEAFARRLQERGLFDRWPLYFRSAGRLAVDCYRREIETALRSRELSGFQLLDFQDFPGQGTALVGVLNALMENKGLISAEEWHGFCGSTVPLARLPRFVLRSGEELSAEVLVSETDPQKQHRHLRCVLEEDGRPLSTVEVALPERQERLIEGGRVSFGAIHADAPRRLTLRLITDCGVQNSWPLWVFPAGEDVCITPEGMRCGDRLVRFVEDAARAREITAAGGAALVVPPAEGKRPAEYCSDFWCYPMFRSISESMGKPWPVGTMGLCIRAGHPALAGFPADEYTTPPWYRLLRHAHCEVMDAHAEMVAEMIDNTERCDEMGVIYLADGVPHCTIRLWEIADEPEARQLARSLIAWLT